MASPGPIAASFCCCAACGIDWETWNLHHLAAWVLSSPQFIGVSYYCLILWSVAAQCCYGVT